MATQFVAAWKAGHKVASGVETLVETLVTPSALEMRNRAGRSRLTGCVVSFDDMTSACRLLVFAPVTHIHLVLEPTGTALRDL